MRREVTREIAERWHHRAHTIQYSGNCIRAGVTYRTPAPSALHCLSLNLRKSTHFTPPFSFVRLPSYLLISLSISISSCIPILRLQVRRRSYVLVFAPTARTRVRIQLQLRLRLHGIDLSPPVCAMPATSQIHASPPPGLLLTPPLPWFRLTLFLALVRLLDLSVFVTRYVH